MVKLQKLQAQKLALAIPLLRVPVRIAQARVKFIDVFVRIQKLSPFLHLFSFLLRFCTSFRLLFLELYLAWALTVSKIPGTIDGMDKINMAYIFFNTTSHSKFTAPQSFGND